MYRAVKDKDTGQIYYFNDATGKSTWKVPNANQIKNPGMISLPSGATVPEGWDEAIDPSTKRRYYLNESTGETSWTIPSKHKTAYVRDVEWTTAEAASVIQGLWRARQARRGLRKLLRSVYQKGYDAETGQFYYYNTRLGISTWTKPKIFGNDDIAVHKAVDFSKKLVTAEYVQQDGDWIEYCSFEKNSDSDVEEDDEDMTIERMFYHNPTTDEFQWEVPDTWNGIEDYYFTKKKAAKKKVSMKKTRKFPRSTIQKLVDVAEDLEFAVDADGATELDLSGLNATKLSSRIWNFETLLTLNLSNNALTRIPSGIQDLFNLVHLDLRENKITKLPTFIQNLSQLEHLLLGGNAISGFSPKVWKLKTLRSLDLSYNLFRELPEREGDLDLLRETSEWVVNIGLLTRLQKCSLQGNTLAQFPSGLNKCQNLTYLDLSDNDLESAPPAVGALVQLEYLDLSQNRLARVPPELGACIHLSNLNLDQNQITNLPSEWHTLTQLVHFDGSNNPLVSFPEVYATSWKLLRGLRLANTPLTRVCLSFPALRTCVGHANALTQVDFEDESQVPLVDLDLTHNHLSVFPELLIRAAALTLVTCNMASNALTDFPLAVFACVNLQTLDLSYNALTTLPTRGFERLGNLESLNLSHNQLLDIPPSFCGCCPKLRHLNLSSNVLTHLPSTLGNLAQLQILKVRRNALERLPSSVEKCSGLRFFDLAHNHFLTRPSANVSFIQSVDWSENPFVTKELLEIEQSKDQVVQRGMSLVQQGQDLTQAHQMLRGILTSATCIDPHEIQAIFQKSRQFPDWYQPAMFYAGLAQVGLCQQIEEKIIAAQEKAKYSKLQHVRYQIQLCPKYRTFRRKRFLQVPKRDKSSTSFSPSSSTPHVTTTLEMVEAEERRWQAQDDEILVQLEIQTQEYQHLLSQKEKSIAGALDQLSCCIRLEYELDSSHYNRGLVHHMNQQFGEAIDDFTACLVSCAKKSAPDPAQPQPPPELYYRRALAYQHLGQLACATSDAQRAFELSGEGVQTPKYFELVETLSRDKAAYYDPAGVDDPTRCRGFFIDASGLRLKSDRQSPFDDSLAQLTAEARAVTQARLELNRQTWETITQRCQRSKDILFEFHAREDLEKAEEDTRAAWRHEEETRAIWARCAAQERQERALMKSEEVLTRWLLKETKAAEDRKAKAEEHRAKKELLGNRVARRGGRGRRK